MAMILDAFVGRYVNKLSEVIEGEISMLLGVEGELKKLRRRMKRIEGFLQSAERKTGADENIDTWVTDLKDVMYDADDIIDLCMIEGKKLLEDHASELAVRHPLPLLSCFSCIKFRHEIGSKIRELNDRLKEIAEDQSILSKLEKSTRQQGHQVSRVNHRQTISTEVETDIVGAKIQEATQSLVESLIKEDNKKCRILGIVGMGGVGKTTLASHVYNNKRIKENFPMRVWKCVSQEFSVTRLLEEIINGAGGSHGEAESEAELITRLSSILSKRFFIVLDDVWTIDVWEDRLRPAFKNATANGSIVITTRDTNVAKSITANIHPVDKMDNDSGWELLRKKVLRDDEEEEEAEEEISRLKEIGVEIVKKCDGLPLAIKVIAKVLKPKKRNTIEWNKVLESDAWSMSQLHEELPGALFLSYENLPSDLKQCFLYCSLFPEDYEMDCDELIRYWVAEGFVKRTQGDIIMEDIAEDFYWELIERNLLQPYHGSDGMCKMHDLLRSLALFLTRDESIFLGEEQSPDINPLTKIRRLSMVNKEARVEVPNAIKQQKCLRTLLLRESYSAKMVDNELFERLRFLRVMDLSATSLESLPDSIGDLLHLRYLNLDRTSISNLPESIGCLVNLQVLNLSDCEYLHTLPKAITKLWNLRCLRLGGETQLSYVPKGIGKLKHLNHLEGFVVGHEGFVVGHDDRGGTEDDEGCDLEELQSLSQLRFLEIYGLERAQSRGVSVLANSHSLRTLILYCVQPYEDEEEEIVAQRISEIYNNELSPQSTHLQRLEIHDFFGTGFPSWMMSPSLGDSFPNLTKITLVGCDSCPQLPPLGLLPQLKSLRIVRADAIETIGPEFLRVGASSAATSFPKLEKLKFIRMSNWEEWSFGMVERVGEERRGEPKLLTRLKKLQLRFCPMLRALPEGLRHATSLQELEIRGAHSLTKIDNLPFLANKLSIWGSNSLKRVSNLPSLKSLKIGACSRLKLVENLDRLQYLHVDLSPSGETSTTDADGQRERLPHWLLELLGQHQNALQSLEEFHLRCSLPLLKTFLKHGPNWPIIQRIPKVRIEESFGTSYIDNTKHPLAFIANVVESEDSVDG